MHPAHAEKLAVFFVFFFSTGFFFFFLWQALCLEPLPRVFEVCFD